MKQRKFFLACFLMITLSLGLTSFAQDGKPRNGGQGIHGHHSPVEFILRDLNLTTEQKDKVRAIFTAERSTIKTILDNNFTNHQKLHDLIKSGDFDLAQVRVIAESLANNQILLIVEKQRGESQIYAILNADQQAKFDQTQTKFVEHKPMLPNENRLIEMLSNKLALTPEQQTQLSNILTRQKEGVTPLLEKLGQFHQQLATLTAKGRFDQIQITNLAGQYVNVMADLTVAHTTTRFNIYSLLTTEQREDFLRFPPLGGPGSPFLGRPEGGRPPS